MVEFLTGTLQSILDTWVNNRETIQEALASRTTRFKANDPHVLQKMALVIGDLGNGMETASSSKPCRHPPRLPTTQATPPPESHADVTRQTSRHHQHSSPVAIQPYPPPSSPTTPIQTQEDSLWQARAILNRVRELGRLPPGERGAIVAVVRNANESPLSIEDHLALARLSHRQLNRLPISRMAHVDRVFIKALRQVKKRESGPG
jgi:hypothetical protein